MTHASPAFSDDVRVRYEAVRTATERLAAPLSPEDQTVQSMPDVSPTKWHRGHTSWFFETFVLASSLAGYAEYDPGFAFIFNSYYETVGPRHARPERGLVTRPGVAEVTRYRNHVDEAMEKLLDHMGDKGEIAFLTELGVNHEQQHQELVLMDIKHVLSRNPCDASYGEIVRSAQAERKVVWIAHPGGVVEIGHDGAGFAFDSESPRHSVLLAPFEIADRPVSCGDWLAFIEDGGYERPELWLSEGWANIQASGWMAPLYWTRPDGPGAGGPQDWSVFTLGGLREVRSAEPVCHLSYFEADAYARWAGSRLPTEAEWEVAAAPFAPSGNTFDEAVCHPVGTGEGPGFYGDVWEWTSSSYGPYPGFRPAAGSIGEYNGKFMVNQYVLRGGCFATPPGHVRATYRNFFPASARWAFSGLRLARDV
jgi:ergothioneine biosynthesis protein EgtB